MIINLTQFLPCQLKCEFCLNKHTDIPLPVEVFNLEKFKDVVKRCVDFGFTRFDLTPNIGDFLLDKEHVKKLMILEETPEIKWYGFVTNYLNPTNELLEFLPYMKTGVVEPSIYGYTREQYLEITGRDLFDKFYENLCNLWDFIRKNDLNPAPIRHYLRCPVMKGTTMFQQMKYIVERFNAQWEWQEFINRNWAGYIPKQSYIERPAIGICAHAVADNGVFPDGKITLCNCWDTYKEMIIGDIFKDDLEDVFSENSVYGNYIKEQMVGIYKGICKDCDDLTIAKESQLKLPWMKRYKKIIERIRK